MTPTIALNRLAKSLATLQTLSAKRFRPTQLLGTFLLALTITACDLNGGSENPTNQESSLHSSITSSPVDVMSAYVRQDRSSLPAPTELDLLTNGGFENGVFGWHPCNVDGIAYSTNTYQGEGALKVFGGNCIYQSVGIEAMDAGLEVVLSCFVKGVERVEWTGLGLGFSDSQWNTISETPATLVGGTDFMRYDVKATVPVGANYVSMWLYSETDALVDSCSLVPVSVAPEPPVVTAENLLENAEFDEQTNGAADNWQTFCNGGSSMSDVNGDAVLQVFDGACVSQALSAGDIARMQDTVYELACQVQFNSDNPQVSEHFATLSINIDGVETRQDIPRNSANLNRISLTIKASENASSGFVAIYAENEAGALKVHNCSLMQFDSGSGNGFGEAANNLLPNGGFDDAHAVTGLPLKWNTNCGGGTQQGTASLVDSPYSDLALNMTDYACLWTILPPEAIDRLKHNSYSLSCDAWNGTAQNTTGNAWIDITYSDEKRDWNQDRLLFAPAAFYEPSTLNGFFGDITHASISVRARNLQLDNCYLQATSDNSSRSSIDVRAQAEGPDQYPVDGPFTFDVVVSNDGTDQLQNIAYSSADISCEGNVAQLAPGESITEQCTSTRLLVENPNDFRAEIFDITVNASATNVNGDVVNDSDQTGHFYTDTDFDNISMDVRAKNKTVLPGDNAVIEVSIRMSGKGSSLSSITSSHASCEKSYAQPLTAGQYDTFECIISNVQADTVVTVNANRYDSSDTIFVYQF